QDIYARPLHDALPISLSAADIRELFDLMGGLEGLAGRLACEKMSDEDIKNIEQLHHDMYGFYIRQDMHGYFHVNQLIHRAIVDRSEEHTSELQSPCNI